MALVLDPTPKGAAANSYGTQAEADSYFEGRLNATAWTGASSGTKDQALVAATARLEQEPYDGVLSSTTQRLKFPRDGLLDDDGNPYDAAVVPRRVKEASFEEALALLQDAKQLDATGLAGFESVTLGPLSVKVRQPEPHGPLSPQAQRLLRGLWRGIAGGFEIVRG